MPPLTTTLDSARSYAARLLAGLRIPGAGMQVADERETLRTLGERRASIARYGDGELEIMIGGGIRFQEPDSVLAQRLRTILRAASPQFLIGIPNFAALQIKRSARVASWQRYRRIFSHLVRRGAPYHSAFVSRPSGITDLESTEYYQAFAALWAGRDVVLVHHSAEVAGHALFRAARRVRHLPCPPEHAFRAYPELLQKAATFIESDDVIFLIAAGPTAGVLAWDLAQRGAQALDIGHLTNVYDDFLAHL